MNKQSWVHVAVECSFTGYNHNLACTVSVLLSTDMSMYKYFTIHV